MSIRLLSPGWWVNMFVTTFITLIFLYLIKSISNKFEIPGVTKIVNETL